ncbi:MAG: Hsp33 family molecular chaperone HslO [Desulfuromonas sp.]|uniref:Hsp33 family molecular chaperone HslO n=1 Tax=Desulfuromonas sp. TaxID=892 RepID=UPI000CB0E121|nr:Hsp33 family molecular chaperone HslO [Desulfuromonas sp.]PLX83530.1 MAG: Hsp33 family molecular chaperone HslO [Desulfuromonas sp.]
MRDHMVRILTEDGALRASAAVTTALVEETRRRQGTDPTATVALGRLVTGAALFGGLLKGRQRLGLSIEGNGPLQKLQAETDADGHLRATVKVPCPNLPPRDGTFDVAGAIGKAGFLHVVKDLGLKEPYRGMVQLYRSTIAEDLAYYLTTSEQTPSTVALGVYLETEGKVAAAGGFLVQAMPGGDESRLPLLEERLKALPPITALLREGFGPEQILEQIFAGIPFAVKTRTDLAFRCSCNRRQVLNLLLALGKEELLQLARQAEPASVTCEYCKERYAFTAEELEALAVD